MKTFFCRKTLSFILCTVLTVATALSTTGCNDSQNEVNIPPASTAAADAGTASGDTVLGEGNTS